MIQKPHFLAGLIFMVALTTWGGGGDNVPSRANFFHEVLYPRATECTPRFNNYTEGSYHPDKLDLLEGLPTYAKEHGQTLRGLLVIGPVLPFWTYHIVALIHEGEIVRINHLVMPQATIAAKSTKLITKKDASEYLRRIASSPILTKAGLSTADVKAKLNPTRKPDLLFDLLLVFWPEEELYISDLQNVKDQERVGDLLKKINAMLETLEETYTHGQETTSTN
ncbi:MAG: hypothetical protein ACE5H0_13810 [Bacteroidota bacterium]